MSVGVGGISCVGVGVSDGWDGIVGVSEGEDGCVLVGVGGCVVAVGVSAGVTPGTSVFVEVAEGLGEGSGVSVGGEHLICASSAF